MLKIEKENEEKETTRRRKEGSRRRKKPSGCGYEPDPCQGSTHKLSKVEPTTRETEKYALMMDESGKSEFLSVSLLFSFTFNYSLRWTLSKEDTARPRRPSNRSLKTNMAESCGHPEQLTCLPPSDPPSDSATSGGSLPWLTNSAVEPSLFPTFYPFSSQAYLCLSLNCPWANSFGPVTLYPLPISQRN